MQNNSHLWQLVNTEETLNSLVIVIPSNVSNIETSFSPSIEKLKNLTVDNNNQVKIQKGTNDKVRKYKASNDEKLKKSLESKSPFDDETPSQTKARDRKSLSINTAAEQVAEGMCILYLRKYRSWYRGAVRLVK